MRIISFLILVLFTYCPTLAQIEAKTIDFNNKLEINLEEEVSARSFGNSIHSVNVIDVRDDTGVIGYHFLKAGDARRYMVKPGTSEKNKNNDIWSKVYHCSPTLKDGFTEWINEYLQCRNNPSVKNKLLIVVKKFWLSAEADKIRYDNDKVGQAING